MADSKLIDILSRTFRCPSDCLGDDADMLAVPGWDSLSHMAMVVALESAYGIEFNGDEIADLQSIAAIRRILQQRGVSP